MNSDLALFFTSRVTDRHRLKRGHRVEAHHLCSKEDTAVCLLFPRADIKFYQAFNIGHIYVSMLDLIQTRRSQMSETLFFASMVMKLSDESAQSLRSMTESLSCSWPICRVSHHSSFHLHAHSSPL
jgi:hypothetical protein